MPKPRRPCLDGSDHLSEPGKSRCAHHESQRKALRNANTAKAKATVEAHVQQHGWWCPGYGTEPHQSYDLTSDHPLAYANGGTNEQDQAVLCRSCNGRKGARTC